MLNHFEMARQMARRVDAGKSQEETFAELRRMFPTATVADWQRAKRITLDRLEILDEERHAAIGSIADQLFGGRPGPVIDIEKLLPSADTLFPQPNKTKS